MDLFLEGKKAIVTGSSSGIGEAIAKRLAQEKAQVMLQGRNEKELKRIHKEINDAGGRAEYVTGDLSDDQAANEVVQKTLKKYGSVDILINNAGAFPNTTWMGTTSKSWNDLFNLNVVSAVRMIQGFLPKMKEKGWGRIIQISSIVGISPPQFQPEYSVTKAADINMTISLARDLAGTGITVNTISPGPIATSGTVELFHTIAKEKNWPDNWKEIEKNVIKEMLPNLVRRFGKPEEIASVAAFLASPLADFITCANYRVDGGMSG